MSGATIRRSPPRFRHRQSLAKALFVTSEVDFLRDNPAAAELTTGCRRPRDLTRTWGDCYGYLMVATGRADVMVDPIMAVWDAAPMLPILQEAGGTFTDWKGNPTIHAGEGVATNGCFSRKCCRCSGSRL